MRRWIWLLTLSTLAACVPASTVLSPPSFETGRVELVRFDPPGVGAGALVVEVHATVRNPNPVGVRLAGLDVELFLGGDAVASSAFPGGLELPARGSAPLRLEVAVPVATAPGLIADVAALVTGTPLDYRVEAALAVDLVGVQQRFPGLTLAQGRLSPPGTGAVPTLQIDPAGARLSLDGTTVTLQVDVLADNPGPFGVEVRSPQLQVVLDGRPLGRAGVPVTPLPAGQRTRIPVRLEVSLAEVGAVLAARIAGAVGSLDLTLQGDWTFGVAGVTLGARSGWTGTGTAQ